MNEIHQLHVNQYDMNYFYYILLLFFYRARTDIVKANSMEEATKMIEAQAKMLGASGVDWIGKRQLD